MASQPLRTRILTVIGVGVIAGSALAVGCPTDPAGTACQDDPAPPNEVRVHVGNLNDVAGIRVTVEIDLSTLNEFCDIGELPVGGELGQVVMTADVGTPIIIRAEFEGTVSRTCTVASSAFQNLPPGAENGQVFADVSTNPTAITCGAGFQSTDLSAMPAPRKEPG